MKQILFSVLLVLLWLGLMFLSAYQMKKTHTEKHTVIKVDTVYNRIVLDSIEYRIKVKDTIIYKIKQKVEEDVKEIINSNDSVALATFNKLVAM